MNHRIMEYYKNAGKFQVSFSKKAWQMKKILLDKKWLYGILINFYLVIVWLKMINE